MTFEYKCVTGPTIVSVKNARVRTEAVRAFEDIMNAQAADGWEYIGIDEFHTSEPEGWLSRKRVYVPTKMLVFRRPKGMAPRTMMAERDQFGTPEAGSTSRVASLSDLRARLETDKA